MSPAWWGEPGADPRDIGDDGWHPLGYVGSLTYGPDAEMELIYGRPPPGNDLPTRPGRPPREFHDGHRVIDSTGEWVDQPPTRLALPAT